MKIAVIGIGCRYPGANSATELYENVLSGRRGFRVMPAERWAMDGYYSPDKKNPDTTYCKKAAVIDGFTFNPAEFRIPRSTFLATDVAQWMALQVAMEALQDAGIDPTHNKTTGVIIGNTLTGEISRATLMRYRWPYVQRVFAELLDNLKFGDDEKDYILKQVEARYKAPFPEVNEDNLAGGLSNTIAGRICNFFDFKGGGFTTDGACSSSLLAINQACIGLVNGACDLALAGGVDISLDPFELVGFAKVGALSDSDIRVYDQFSNGFLPGEGCGIVVLQRYEDAVDQGRRIYAVIHGIGISSDGKGGITAPNVGGQTLAVNRAYEMADYSFADVEMIEGHGTGTPTGDKVELTTFVESKARSSATHAHRCGIGSIKSNIGHTKAAAGVAGFIKAVMSVCYGVMPQTQGVTSPNHLFRDSDHLYPILQGRLWSGDGKPRRAAVSSAGFGGINTHVTLSSDHENSKANNERSEYFASLVYSSQSSEAVFIGADSLADMKEKVDALAAVAGRISMAELADLANYCIHNFTANRIRLAVVAATPEQLHGQLATVAEFLQGVDSEHDVELVDKKDDIYLLSGLHQPRVAYLFPGQASQHLNMGLRLRSRSASFREVLENCAQILQPVLGRNLCEVIYRDVDSAAADAVDRWQTLLNDTAITQPAVTAISLASAHFLRELGVRPDLAIGHSLGEFSALHSAGALDLEQTLNLVAKRGRAMAASSRVEGAMLSLGVAQARAQELVDRIDRANSDDLVISNINSPTQTIVSGTRDAVESLYQLCSSQDIHATLLPVSTAFHSRLMSKAAEEMQGELETIRFGRLRHLLISSATADFISHQKELPDLLTRQILLPVNFVGAIEAALNEEIDVFVEVGPGAVLSGLTKAIAQDSEALICAMDIGDRGQQAEGLHRLAAYLFACGVPLNKQKLFEGRFFRPFSLPYAPSFITSPCEVAVEPLDLALKEGDAGAGFFTLDAELLAQQDQHGDEQTADNEADGADAVLHLLKAQIVKDFGYSEDMISTESVLEEDLGLDSLKSVELLLEVMGSVGVKADVSEMRARNLGDIAEFVYQLKSQSQGGGDNATAADIDTPLPTWVRCYQMQMVSQVLPAIDLNALNGGTFVLAYESDSAIVGQLQALLENAQAKVQRVKIGTDELGTAKCHGCIYLVNQVDDVDAWLAADETAIQRKYARPKALLALSQMLLKAPGERQKVFLLAAVDGAQFWQQAPEGNAEAVNAEAGPGFVKTLHLENPHMLTRCVEISGELSAVTASESLLAELLQSDAHSDARIDSQGRRSRAEYSPISPATLPSSREPLLQDDVVLVTGGAKGITAECAFALGQQLGVKLALVGSTPLPGDADQANEASVNLQRFRDADIHCEYFACDITRGDRVRNLVRDVESSMGPVRAVIHAAGVNNLQKIATADWQAYERVLLPKVQGLSNLVTAVDVDALKSLMVFSSVIANSGMAGNAEYAYANEWMNQLLRRLQCKFPALDCRAFGFSVWADVGMGARHNSTDLLAGMGINAIPVAAGCETFMQLVNRRWPDGNLVVSSRMGDLGTLTFSAHDVPQNRFLETIKYQQPGVELIAEVFLAPDKDRFLRHHLYDGSMLFPAVMGIEAMVQAASACRLSAGMSVAELPVLENLEFKRAVIVPESGRAIRIYIQLLPLAENGEQRALASIRSSATDYAQEYFSAECLWSPQRPAAAKRKQTDAPYLDLDPQRDLYGKVLFQGPMFQNIIGYKELTSTHGVVDIRLPEKIELFSDGGVNANIMFGSGQVRDAFLHAVQLCVPEYRILPVSMDRVVYYGYDNDANSDKLTLYAVERERSEHDFLYDLEAYDEAGNCVEKIIGFRCRIMKDYGNVENINTIHRVQQEFIASSEIDPAVLAS